MGVASAVNFPHAARPNQAAHFIMANDYASFDHAYRMKYVLLRCYWSTFDSSILEHASFLGQVVNCTRSSEDSPSPFLVLSYTWSRSINPEASRAMLSG